MNRPKIMDTKEMKHSILTVGLAICLAASMAYSYNLKKQLKTARHLDSHEGVAIAEEFDRRGLIQRLDQGDKDAAFELGRYYGSLGIYEASWYWFQMAVDMGHPGLTQEVVDGVKKGIINSELNSE